MEALGFLEHFVGVGLVDETAPLPSRTCPELLAGGNISQVGKSCGKGRLIGVLQATHARVVNGRSPSTQCKLGTILGALITPLPPGGSRGCAIHHVATWQPEGVLEPVDDGKTSNILPSRAPAMT